LGSHQEYLDRRHRIDSIEIGAGRSCVRLFGGGAPQRSAKREYLLQKQFLAAARAAELAPQESARRSEGACGGDAKDAPGYEHPRSRSFLRDVLFRAHSYREKMRGALRMAHCRNRAAELERVASPATLSSTACVEVYIILYITVICCSPARPRGASTGVGRAEAEIFLLATA
jgi:hypothetical protein